MTTTELRRIEFVVPQTLPPGVNPNGARIRANLKDRAAAKRVSRHWARQAEGRAKLKSEARLAALAYAPGVRMARARITITLLVCRSRGIGGLWPAYRPTDRDNLLSACKGLIDGLVAARLIPDDKAEHVDYGNPSFEEVPSASLEGIRVLLEELPAEEEAQP